MKYSAGLTVLAWLILFAWVGAFQIGMVAALLSFIGLCLAFLIAQRFNILGAWGYSIAGALLAPILAALVAEAWISVFPPPPCTGDDCVKVTVRIAGEL